MQTIYIEKDSLVGHGYKRFSEIIETLPVQNGNKKETVFFLLKGARILSRQDTVVRAHLSVIEKKLHAKGYWAGDTDCYNLTQLLLTSQDQVVYTAPLNSSLVFTVLMTLLNSNKTLKVLNEYNPFFSFSFWEYQQEPYHGFTYRVATQGVQNSVILPLDQLANQSCVFTLNKKKHHFTIPRMDIRQIRTGSEGQVFPCPVTENGITRDYAVKLYTRRLNPMDVERIQCEIDYLHGSKDSFASPLALVYNDDETQVIGILMQKLQGERCPLDGISELGTEKAVDLAISMISRYLRLVGEGLYSRDYLSNLFYRESGSGIQALSFDLDTQQFRSYLASSSASTNESATPQKYINEKIASPIEADYLALRIACAAFLPTDRLYTGAFQPDGSARFRTEELNYLHTVCPPLHKLLLQAYSANPVPVPAAQVLETLLDYRHQNPAKPSPDTEPTSTPTPPPVAGDVTDYLADFDPEGYAYVNLQACGMAAPEPELKPTSTGKVNEKRSDSTDDTPPPLFHPKDQHKTPTLKKRRSVSKRSDDKLKGMFVKWFILMFMRNTNIVYDNTKSPEQNWAAIVNSGHFLAAIGSILFPVLLFIALVIVCLLLL